MAANIPIVPMVTIVLTADDDGAMPGGAVGGGKCGSWVMGGT